MATAGFAGNQRYLMVTTAAVSVLGGVGAVRVLQGMELLGDRWFAGRSPRAGAITAAVALVIGVAIASPTIVAKADNTGRVQGGIEHEAFLWHDLKALIDVNGGKERLLACGGVFSGPFQTQMVAYELGVHGINVGWKVTPAPGAAFRTRTVPDGPPAWQVAAPDGAARRQQARRVSSVGTEHTDGAPGGVLGRHPPSRSDRPLTS